MSETDKLALAVRYGIMLGVLYIMFELFISPVWFLVPADSTDATNERSGMMLLTDHGTGCQYLSKLGGLTPRLDEDGRHICASDSGGEHD